MKNHNQWIRSDEHTKAFNKLKEGIIKTPRLAHYNAQSENIITTDASTKGLGATLWQNQKNRELKPIRFASRFLSGPEKCIERERTFANSKVKKVKRKIISINCLFEQKLNIKTRIDRKLRQGVRSYLRYTIT